MKISKKVKGIASAIKDAGGNAFLVGGTVRDMLFERIHGMPIKSKDLDIEVFGLPTDDLVAVLSQFGQVKEVGKAFGVIKMDIDDEEFDFSLPRREKKNGTGHTGFDVVPDHTMSIDEAVLRRDFTMNALMLDITSEEIIDKVDGTFDIKHKRLLHVSDRFAEDPLRVLRGFQFAARFGLEMHPHTVDMCKGLKGEFHTLSKERIEVEFHKFFLKGIDFEKGFEVLRLTGWAEFFGLDINTTEITVKLNRLKKKNSTDKTSDDAVGRRKALMMSAIIEKEVPNFVDNVFLENNVINKAKELREINKHFEFLCNVADFEDFCIDTKGRMAIGHKIKRCSFDEAIVFLNIANGLPFNISANEVKPVITGGDLIKKGWKPSVHKAKFGQELKRLFTIQLSSNASREKMLKLILNPDR